MTELEWKAETYFNLLKKYNPVMPNVDVCVKQAYKDGYEQGYVSGEFIADKAIESLQAKNAELKAEIEKLKVNIANLKDWAELDIDEEGEPIV